MKTKNRTDQSAEFFTSDELCNKIISDVKENDPNIFSDTTCSVLDPTCGNGQFVMALLSEKVMSYCNDASDDLLFDLKSDALKETYGVDLMASNIADLIARIVFWKRWDMEIFDKRGNPKSELILPFYDDDDTAYWLKDYIESGNIYSRKYSYEGKNITVRSRSNKWWMFEYYVHGDSAKCYTGGGFCHNFIVADSLKYDFEFNDEPLLETESEKRERENNNRVKDQNELNSMLLEM